MSNPYRKNSEFGEHSEEYPVMREPAYIPGEEWLSADNANAPEDTSPAPEITLPGNFSSDNRDRADRRRRRLKKLMFAFAAACIMFVAFKPLGLFKSTQAGGDIPPEEPENTFSLDDITDIPGDDDEPSIRIDYALLNGDTVEYSYFVLPGESQWNEGGMISGGWVYPVSVEAKVVDETGNTAYASDNPDIWEGSRGAFIYTVDAAGLTGEMKLVLTGSFTHNGTDKAVTAVRSVDIKPPEADTYAEVEAEADDSFTVSYHAKMTPQTSDKTAYDLETTAFYFSWYDENEEYMGGNGSVWNENDESVLPQPVFENSSYNISYEGPSSLSEAGDTVGYFSVVLELKDRNTGLPVTIETGLQPVPKPVEDDTIPYCDIIAYAFSSEMHADLVFSDMHKAYKVTLEVWDPRLETLESSEDITREALEESTYHVEPFFTDVIFHAHEDYYNYENYPESVRFTVVINYTDEGFDRTVSYSAETTEENGVFIKYLPDSESTWDPENAGSLYFSIEPSVGIPYNEVYFNQPEKVTGPGIVSITVTIDGKKIPASDFMIDNYEMTNVTFEDGRTADITYTEVRLKRPAGINEGEGKKAVVSITHYLTGRDMVWTTEKEMEFTVEPD